jgi:hypothetical protein
MIFHLRGRLLLYASASSFQRPSIRLHNFHLACILDSNQIVISHPKRFPWPIF